MNETEYKTFLFTYHYDDSEWGFDIKARTANEAKERLARLPYASYDGEVMATIPVHRKLECIILFILKILKRKSPLNF